MKPKPKPRSSLKRAGRTAAHKSQPRPAASPDNAETPAMPDQPFVEGAADTLDPDLRHRLISETAYHHLEERGFADGSEVDDWAQAEAEVDHTLINPAEPLKGSD